MSFAKRTVSKIWQEEPSKTNPYLVEKCRCHGYELFDLAEKRSFADVLFLLFRGELPTEEESELLEWLLITLINPGPRHPATRAGMNASVSRVNPAHILPISLSVMGGDRLGGGEVMAAMRFMREQQSHDPLLVLEQVVASSESKATDARDVRIPGFGNRFGGIDPFSQKLADRLIALPGAGSFLNWGQIFTEALSEYNMGWLVPGVLAAALLDLGFDVKAGPGLLQLFSAPGLLAHGLEMASQPITAMPFLDEEHYIIADEAQKR